MYRKRGQLPLANTGDTSGVYEIHPTTMAANVKPASKSKASLLNAVGYKSLITFTVLALAWLVGFASRLFAVIRFESIIHEFDPWYVSIRTKPLC